MYRWVDGTRLSNYAQSWIAWSEYTAKPAFAASFAAVLASHDADVDDMSVAVEQFLLTEAIGIGVVKKQIIKAAANPNK